jgi:hypothetical protein
MGRPVAILLAAFLAGVPSQGFAQTSLPSTEEISELAAKADQKVDDFEKSLKTAKPWLDKIDSKLSTNYLDAATTAHTIIGGIQKEGPSGYRLVSLLATLDDLSLDAANGNVQLMGAYAASILGGAPEDAILTAVTGLSRSGTACNDIAELIMHATLQFIQVEERLLDELLKPSK